MSADVCLKFSPGYCLQLMLTFKSCCTVSLTIPYLLTVKRQIRLCSRWLNVPTLTYKTQLASILSISCNIEHLAQQQSQCKLQWSILRKEPFATSSRQILQIDNAFHAMTSSREWLQEQRGSRKSPSPWGTAQLAIQIEACGRETTRNAHLKQWREL